MNNKIRAALSPCGYKSRCLAGSLIGTSRRAAQLSFMLVAGFVLLLPLLAGAKEVTKYAQEEVEKGWGFFRDNDLDEALGRFNQAIIMDPAFAPAYYGKAHVYSARNQPGEAIKFFRKTIELSDPPMVEAFVNLGFTLTLAGHEEEGYEMYMKALAIDPNNKDAHINLAHYYCGQLNGAKAWEHIRTALSLGGKMPEEQLADMRSICPEEK
ncbi:MAG: tetratricopeptide repeat protein [Proteobacteria bacterium]|nr:tetratricopeptide repeat protein [Pseudomonadota bacterium]MBU1739389.1 tetratricopeptide repeat protein [Pseudomonadota bacterium]